jgi:hypothetical protein
MIGLYYRGGQDRTQQVYTTEEDRTGHDRSILQRRTGQGYRSGHDRYVLQRRTGLDIIDLYYRGGQDRTDLYYRGGQDRAIGQDRSLL